MAKTPPRRASGGAVTAGKAYVFSWQDTFADGRHGRRDPDASFWEWFVPTVVAHDDIDNLLSADPGWTERVTLTMQINGIEVDVKHFIDRMRENLDYSVELGIKEKARELRFEVLDEAIAKMETAVRREMFTRMREAGIPFDDDDD